MIVFLPLCISGFLNLQNSFGDYFASQTPSYSYNKMSTFIKLQTGNSYFYECNFIGLSSISYGGAIQFQDYSSIKCLLVIEKCSFKDCSTTTQYKMTSYGGAIYFSTGPKGGFGMGDVIAIRCYTGSGGGGDGQFAKISGLDESIVKLKRTSINFCGLENEYRNNIINLQMKAQYYSYSNVSNNRAQQTASINFFFPDNMFFSFSTLSQNWAKFHNILWLSGGKSNLIQSLIFVKNSQGSYRNSGIINNLAGSITIFQDCTFLKNMENKVGVLFYSDSGSLIVKNYKCDTCKPKKHYGTVIFQ